MKEIKKQFYQQQITLMNGHIEKLEQQKQDTKMRSIKIAIQGMIDDAQKWKGFLETKLNSL